MNEVPANNPRFLREVRADFYSRRQPSQGLSRAGTEYGTEFQNQLEYDARLFSDVIQLRRTGDDFSTTSAIYSSPEGSATDEERVSREGRDLLKSIFLWDQEVDWNERRRTSVQEDRVDFKVRRIQPHQQAVRDSANAFQTAWFGFGSDQFEAGREDGRVRLTG